MIERTTYTISCDDESRPSTYITVNADEMIVYDVCRIKDYEGADYVPRKAKLMNHVVLPNPHDQEAADKEAAELFEDVDKGGL